MKRRVFVWGVLASLVIAAGVAGCASAEGGGDESDALLFGKPGTPPTRAPTAKPGTQPLTAGECRNLKGNIVQDDACPQSSSSIAGGGKLQGHFSCQTSGGGKSCIDENS